MAGAESHNWPGTGIEYVKVIVQKVEQVMCSVKVIKYI